MKAGGPLYAAFETMFWNLALPFTVVGDGPPKEPLKELGGLLINVVGWISALGSASSSDESTPRNFGPSSSESRLMTTFGCGEGFLTMPWGGLYAVPAGAIARAKGLLAGGTTAF
jgi:hypothetical protein